jgi:hypothetical protein
MSTDAAVAEAVIVARGAWLYGGTDPVEVLIVRLNYDFWHGIGEAVGYLDADEVPALNPDGYLFYVRTTPGWCEGKQFWPDSLGSRSLSEAKADAQARLRRTIAWT